MRWCAIEIRGEFSKTTQKFMLISYLNKKTYNLCQDRAKYKGNYFSNLNRQFLTAHIELVKFALKNLF